MSHGLTVADENGSWAQTHFQGSTMVYYLKLYCATLVAFLALDAVWLGLVARSFYHNYLGFLLAPNTNWLAAAVFYLLFIVGILSLVVVPGLEADSLRRTLVRAALFGLITYWFIRQKGCLFELRPGDQIARLHHFQLRFSTLNWRAETITILPDEPLTRRTT
jgi:hypothetical protein